MQPVEIGAKTVKEQGRGEFSPADALAAFSADFLDDQACRAWVVSRMHPRGPKCPHCGVRLTDERRLERWRRGLRIQCRECGGFFTVTSGTLLAGKHCDFKQAFLLAACIGLGLDNNGIAALVGCNPETVRLWRHRFEALAS